CTLTEDHVRNAFALSECDQALGRPISFHPDDSRTEALRQRDVFAQGLGIAMLNLSWTFLRGLDVHGVPLRPEAACDAGAGTNDARRQDVRAHADHHSLWNECGFQPFAHAVARRLLADLVGNRSQRELAQ